MTLDAIRVHLRQLSRGLGPIIVGPWLSEVGFELLYWIPFLRRVLAEAKIDPERLFVVSRGGCRSWYTGIAPNYLELYDLYTPADLRALNAKRIKEQAARGRLVGLRTGQVTAKQYYESNVEKQMVAAVAERAGLPSPRVLHPSLMYGLFRPLWRRRSSDLFGQWHQLTLSHRLAATPTPVGLPEHYVAVKFYASEACPDQPERRGQVQKAVRLLTDRTDVVLLHTGTAYDEHGEFAVPDHPRLHRLTFAPGTNLDDQTAIIAGAEQFIGTYGGFAYLAPFLGVPTLTLYSKANFRRDHLRLMTEVANRLRTPFRIATVPEGLSIIRRRPSAHAA